MQHDSRNLRPVGSSYLIRQLWNCNSWHWEEEVGLCVGVSWPQGEDRKSGRSFMQPQITSDDPRVSKNNSHPCRLNAGAPRHSLRPDLTGVSSSTQRRHTKLTVCMKNLYLYSFTESTNFMSHIVPCNQTIISRCSSFYCQRQKDKKKNILHSACVTWSCL